MKTTHELTVLATCPVDEQPDVYQVLVESTRVIRVEDVLAQVQKLNRRPIYQEHFTAKLARALGAGVTTTGYHSGVKTTCKA